MGGPSIVLGGRQEAKGEAVFLVRTVEVINLAAAPSVEETTALAVVFGDLPLRERVESRMIGPHQ